MSPEFGSENPKSIPPEGRFKIVNIYVDNDEETLVIKYLDAEGEEEDLEITREE